MDTLPLPDQVGLSVESLPVSEKLETSKGRFYTNKSNFRKIPQQTIKFTQYTDNLLSIRQFLLDHHGLPFLWNYTGKQYFCLEASFNYQRIVDTRVTGTVTLTLQLNTNVD